MQLLFLCCLRYKKQAYTFSRISVDIKFVTISWAGGTEQSFKEIELNKSLFSTLPTLNPLTDFHDS